MAEKEVFGHINCPYCGTAGGMRITADRNGAPFGFCEANCDGQLRVGGKARRVDAFLKMHPAIAEKMHPEQAKKPVTVTGPEKAENAAQQQVKKPSFSLEF